MIDKSLIERLAYRIWTIFDKEEIINTPESNYLAAENIIKRILADTDKLEDFKTFFNSEDYERIEKIAGGARVKNNYIA